MPEDFDSRQLNYTYTQNRELSWLRFNRRVLEEANGLENPPLERLKFVSIFGSNLDEFFMVRVGSLFDIMQIYPDQVDNKTGMNAAEQLDKIYEHVPELINLKAEIYAGVMDALKAYGVEDVEYSDLTASERKYVAQYYKTRILPILSPMIIGSHHPAPHLVNKKLYIAALLQNKKGKSALGVIAVPNAVAPYVKVEGTDMRYIRSENIILRWAGTLFGDYDVAESCVISVTRNADLSFDDEKFDDSDEDIRNKMMKLLRKRNMLSAVRLEISKKVSDELLTMLKNIAGVRSHQVCIDTCPLHMGYVYSLASDMSDYKARALQYEPYSPRIPEDYDPKSSAIEQIRQGDRMLFYPYHSVEPFLHLLNEAADRPDVVSIKITIYRLASSSKIVQALSRAAQNGKEVLVLMELRARFDEANNVAWSRLLEDAGCQVIYGIEDFKCHSKVCLITMKNRGRVSYITQIGTGNYNEKTNAMYTDLSMMCASDALGEDASAYFRNMLISNLDGEYEELLVAPRGIKSTILRHIDEQIAKGSQGYICIKANSVTEREVLDKLREASMAGVKIEMIIRGICCLLPGVPGETENIEVTSIVGRYLEHARIYCFGRGDDAKMYISSADLMTRNLNRRVEVACPVYDPEAREMIRKILEIQLSDNVKASFMQPDGSYKRKRYPGMTPLDSQYEFMKNPLHHKRPEPQPQKAPPLNSFKQRLMNFLGIKKK